MTADKPSRKFLDGKKKANTSSPFQLRTSLEPFDDEEDEKLYEHLSVSSSFSGDRSSKLLYQCLNPNIHAAHAHNDNKNTIQSTIISLDGGTSQQSMSIKSNAASVVSSLREYIRPHLPSSEAEAGRVLNQAYSDLLFKSVKYSHENRGLKFNSRTDGGGSEKDNALSEWQRFSVSESVRIKDGPQMTLPVLIQLVDELGPQSKYMRGKRAKRWSSGGLVPIGGVEESMPIDGPSSYLDVYKNKHNINAKKAK